MTGRTPTRRAILAATAPVAADILVAPFVRSAPASSTNPDAALLALREPWKRTLGAFNDALNVKDAVDTRAMERWPTYPDYGAWSGDYASFQVEVERITAERQAIGDEEGCAEAKRKEDATLSANVAIVDQIAAMPARTLAGLALKAKVSAEWLHNRENLTASIMDDIARLAISS